MYSYRTEWSPEDRVWVGLVAEFPSLSWLDADQLAALLGIMQLVADVADDMVASGEMLG